LALRYNIPLIPTRIIRIGKEFKFEIEVDKPIQIPDNQKVTEEAAIDLTTQVNKKLEDWIRQYPSQWFWVHDRWKR
jgi:KDO2-lipid IV(A) lauroyltransferase